MAQPSSIFENIRQQRREFPRRAEMISRRFEHQATRIPTGTFLGLAIGSMALSAGVAAFAERKQLASFFGLWAPSLLMLGVFSKLVRIEEGQEEYSPAHEPQQFQRERQRVSSMY